MADHGSHARHDRFAIAEAVGGGVVPATTRTCPACGTLHADLLSIRSAIRHAWLPARPRDLSLTLADAARSRPSGWRHAVGVIGSSRDVASRPLAATFMALGIAGLLLTTVPLGASESGQTAPQIEVESNATGGSEPANREEQRAVDTVEPNPVAVVSIGLLGAGGAIFGLRCLAGRARVMR